LPKTRLRPFERSTSEMNQIDFEIQTVTQGA
jgi:hypothetical protein